MRVFFENIIARIDKKETHETDKMAMDVVLYESKTCKPDDVSISFNKSAGLIKNQKYQSIYLNITSKRQNK